MPASATSTRGDGDDHDQEQHPKRSEGRGAAAAEHSLLPDVYSARHGREGTTAPGHAVTSAGGYPEGAGGSEMLDFGATTRPWPAAVFAQLSSALKLGRTVPSERTSPVALVPVAGMTSMY
jgi:hypothetical protein